VNKNGKLILTYFIFERFQIVIFVFEAFKNIQLWMSYANL